MKILLTGASGQVGREVVDLLRGSDTLLAFSRSDLDITQVKQIQTVISKHYPAIIINAAAYTAVDKAEQDIELAYAVNRDGVKNLAEVGKAYNIPIIHLSTDYVFDGGKASPYREDDAIAPLSVYGQSKAIGEAVLREIWPKHIILRTSWVFGQYGNNFVKTILRLASNQAVLKIVADQTGCPTPARDIAGTVIFLAEQCHHHHKYWGTYHYTGAEPTNWFEFAKKIVEFGQNHYSFKVEKIEPINTNEFKTAAVRPKNSVLNQDKIFKVWGIRPANWELRLAEVVELIRDQK